MDHWRAEHWPGHRCQALNRATWMGVCGRDLSLQRDLMPVKGNKWEKGVRGDLFFPECFKLLLDFKSVFFRCLLKIKLSSILGSHTLLPCLLTNLPFMSWRPTCHMRRLHCFDVAFDNGHLCHYGGWAAPPLCPTPVSWAASLTDLLEKLQSVSVTGKLSYVKSVMLDKCFGFLPVAVGARQHTCGEVF